MTLPPGPATPAVVQAFHALTAPLRGIPRLRDRYGDAFTIQHPVFRRTVVISNPGEVRQLLLTSPEIADNLDINLGRVLGPGSLFALRGEAHRRQRKLLVPPFHGRRLAAYERIVEEETVRELATWPEDRPFATMPSMMRITLNVILRAVFGAEGTEFAQLRELLPRAVALGSRLALLPLPRSLSERQQASARLPRSLSERQQASARLPQRLFGLSPWGRYWAMRRQYDAIVERLIAAAERSGDLDGRDDILAMMLCSRYDDGCAMSHAEIADQLLTLLVAGHETTATTLAWAVERLRRHPEVLRALVEEADAGDEANGTGEAGGGGGGGGGGTLRQATIYEVQRTRPVIDLIGRQIRVDGFRLGRWTLPRGCVVLVSIALLHQDESVFPNARTFDPRRFLDAKPDLYQWIPFGGGTRRCLGAAFATMEMNVVLRTMLRDTVLVPTEEPDERWRSRGIASAPGKGGVAVVRRRTPAMSRRSGLATQAS